MSFGLPKWGERSKTRRLINAVFIFALICATVALVYITGGVHYAFPHAMYIPIILGAYLFGFWGSAASALLGGFALGPFMPQDVELNIAQPTASWIFRIVFYLIIGLGSSYIFSRIAKYKEADINRAFISVTTGFPNIIKLNLDMDDYISKNTSFVLIGFRVVNLKPIKQNINYDTAIKSLIKSMELLSKLSNKEVYFIYADEFATILPNATIEEAQTLADQFLQKTMEPLLIDTVKIGLLIKAGVIHYPMHAQNTADVIKKMGMVLDQSVGEIGLHIYNSTLEAKSRYQADLIPNLLRAIKNQEFTLVYQPRVSLKGDTTLSVEALLRWNHPTKGEITPCTFIKTAEETGLICEINKWVIKTVIAQKEKWQQAGMNVNISVNISPKEFNNSTVINFFNDLVEKEQRNLTLIELELTERDIIDNIDDVNKIFNHYRKWGIKFSLDDYGTGYTSLANLIKLPVDYIKIDMSLISQICDPSYRLAIQHVIENTHSLGRKVIAEGVETKEQVEILKELGCDYIQGFYFSKPLRPDDLEAFYKNLNINSVLQPSNNAYDIS